MCKKKWTTHNPAKCRGASNLTKNKGISPYLNKGNGVPCSLTKSKGNPPILTWTERNPLSDRAMIRHLI